MALITVNVSAQGTTGFATPKDLTIDTGSIQYLLDGGNTSTLRVLYEKSVQDWIITTDFSDTKDIIAAAAPNAWIALAPTSFNATSLYYQNAYIPYSSINNISGTTLSFLPTGTTQGTVYTFSGSGITPTAVYAQMVTDSVQAGFAKLTGVTIFNAIAAPSTTVLINRANIQNLILTTTAGVRDWMYNFGNSGGLIRGSEVHTYTYTSPTFGGSDTMDTLTVQPLGSAPIAHSMGTLPIQTGGNKTAVANAIKAYITSLGEAYTTVTVTGGTTSMVITATGCTLPLNSVTLSIPNTTTFVVS